MGPSQADKTYLGGAALKLEPDNPPACSGLQVVAAAADMPRAGWPPLDGPQRQIGEREKQDAGPTQVVRGGVSGIADIDDAAGRPREVYFSLNRRGGDWLARGGTTGGRKQKDRWRARCLRQRCAFFARRGDDECRTRSDRFGCCTYVWQSSNAFLPGGEMHVVSTAHNIELISRLHRPFRPAANHKQCVCYCVCRLSIYMMNALNVSLAPLARPRLSTLGVHVHVQPAHPPRQQHVQRVQHNRLYGLVAIEPRAPHRARPVLVRRSVHTHGVGSPVDVHAGPDDHTHVVEVEALDRVHAAHLVDRVVAFAPGHRVSRRELVPPQPEPAAARHIPVAVSADAVRVVVGAENPALAVLRVLAAHALVHLLAVVKHLELKVAAEPLAGHGLDVSLEAHPLHPLQHVRVVLVCVAEVHAELLLQLVLAVLTTVLAQHVFQRTAVGAVLGPELVGAQGLALVVHHDGDLAGLHDLREVVLAVELLVGVLARGEKMRLVDYDEVVEQALVLLAVLGELVDVAGGPLDVPLAQVRERPRDAVVEPDHLRVVHHQVVARALEVLVADLAVQLLDLVEQVVQHHRLARAGAALDDVHTRQVPLAVVADALLHKPDDVVLHLHLLVRQRHVRQLVDRVRLPGAAVFLHVLPWLH